jgi:hypothetical protein
MLGTGSAAEALRVAGGKSAIKEAASRTANALRRGKVIFMFSAQQDFKSKGTRER